MEIHAIKLRLSWLFHDQKAFAAGVPHQTQMGKVTALPRPLACEHGAHWTLRTPPLLTAFGPNFRSFRTQTAPSSSNFWLCLWRHCHWFVAWCSVNVMCLINKFTLTGTSMYLCFSSSSRWYAFIASENSPTSTATWNSPQNYLIHTETYLKHTEFLTHTSDRFADYINCYQKTAVKSYMHYHKISFYLLISWGKNWIIIFTKHPV